MSKTQYLPAGCFKWLAQDKNDIFDLNTILYQKLILSNQKNYTKSDYPLVNEKIEIVLTFKQSQRLKRNIDFNTKKKKAINSFGNTSSS